MKKFIFKLFNRCLKHGFWHKNHYFYSSGDDFASIEHNGCDICRLEFKTTYTKYHLTKWQKLKDFVYFSIYEKCRVKFYDTFGRCALHGWDSKLERYRMHTAYVHEEDNWSTGCELCQKDCHQYYDDLWDDFYRSR